MSTPTHHPHNHHPKFPHHDVTLHVPETTPNFKLEAIKFVVVGGLNTLVDWAVLFLLTYPTNVTTGLPYAIMRLVSFTIATVNSYYFNKTWTFMDESAGSQVRKFSHFLAVSVVGALINVGISTAVVTYIPPMWGVSAQVWVFVGAACGTAVALIWNFFGYKFLVFKK